MSRSDGPHAVAIFRDQAYSPHQHRRNDSAILDATLEALRQAEWTIETIEEAAVLEEPLPPADVYLNMAQGPAAARVLLGYQRRGARFVNRPSGVLRCHRHRMIPALMGAGLPVPETVLVETRRAPDPAILGRFRGGGPIWLKRGGVHAEQDGDVRRIELDQLAEGLAAFAKRGIRIAAVQAHLDGPVVKFYGVAGGALFHAYLQGAGDPAPLDRADPDRLRHLAFRAAARFRLEVFGGDFVIHPERGPVLLDINDWPSFAPIRTRAASAIAGYVQALHPAGALR
jgi:glutathione synthase/RimK-type ligase-like ATP-grasp enzyme